MILALDAAGIDVVARGVMASQRNCTVPPRILDLEAKDPRGCDAVIQYYLPPQFEYFGGRIGRHVGFYFTETNYFGDTSWSRHINLLDEAWTASRASRDASLASGVEIPVRVVPPSCDLTRYDRQPNPLPLRDKLKDRFVFYFVGEATRRKNIQALVRAFHLEFDPSEPVELLIQSTHKDMDCEGAESKVKQICGFVKESLALYKDERHYKREILITDYLDDATMLRLHDTGDCFVSASTSEGLGLPALDALAKGKTPIVGAHSGHLEFVSDAEGWLVNCNEEPASGMRESHGLFYTGRQTWWSPDINHLRAAMREAFEKPELRRQKAIAGMRRSEDFSLRKVGIQMKEIIES